VSEWDGLTDPGHPEEEEENSSEMIDRLMKELVQGRNRPIKRGRAKS
jgi:hypothetical protein